MSKLLRLLAAAGMCLALAAGSGLARASDRIAGEESHAEWRQQLDEGRAAIVSAQQRLETARATYQDWRQRKYPRGARKQELVQEMKDAETGLADAHQAWDELLERARRAGVPPGVLRDYED